MASPGLAELLRSGRLLFTFFAVLLCDNDQFTEVHHTINPLEISG